MATVSHQDTLHAADSSKLPTIKVCMHVLGPARTDVRVMRAATTLIAAGYAVSVVDIANEEEHIQREETVRGVSIKHIGVSSAFSATRFGRRALLRALLLFLRCAWRLLRSPADIYHAHDVASLPACYLVSLLRRKPLVYEAHEMPLFERARSEMSRGQRLVRGLLAIVLAHIIPRCAGVITVSPPIVEEIRRRYAISSVTLLRNLPEYQEVPRSDRLLQRLGLAPGTRIVLYQGNLQPNRELDRLVRAASFLASNTVLVMMGKDMKSTASKLKALIALEGVEERVKILPAVPYEELLLWTASADMGLAIFAADYSLNVSMFLPNKLFEYIMAGTPVLASRIGPIVEVIDTYKVGRVVPSLSPAAIAEAIHEMLADEQTLALMRRNALLAAHTELCWEKECPRLIALYQKIQRRQRVHIATTGKPSMVERKE